MMLFSLALCFCFVRPIYRQIGCSHSHPSFLHSDILWCPFCIVSRCTGHILASLAVHLGFLLVSRFILRHKVYGTLVKHGYAQNIGDARLSLGTKIVWLWKNQWGLFNYYYLVGIVKWLVTTGCKQNPNPGRVCDCPLDPELHLPWHFLILESFFFFFYAMPSVQVV